MSITGIARQEVDEWAKVLADNSHWLNNATLQEIIGSLNRSENICTPGFLLRRHIQSHFPQLLAKIGDVADLAESGNIPWEKKSVKALANVLAGTFFEDYGGKLLESRQWMKYLLDEALCQRATAIKIIFALKMDAATAAKFLIANDNNLFSARNPFDFICKFCLNCTPRIPYSEASEMLSEFETARAAAPQKTKTNPEIGMTTDMTNEISQLAKDANISKDDKKKKLLAYMKSHEGEFVSRGSRGYPSGFSLQNISKLKKLMQYLAALYPGNIIIGENDEPVIVPIETDDNGVPRAYEFVQAIYYMQRIDLRDHMELGLPERGAELNDYYRIPFNHDVLLKLNTLSAALYASIRAETHPANAQDISRSTIMILAYFFITGYLYAEEVTAMNFSDQLDLDADSGANDSEKMLIDALRQITYKMDEVAESANLTVPVFVSSLNLLLACFNFNEFYPPFVLDRFIMICLLADPLHATVDEYEELLQFLMQFVIEENYPDQDEEQPGGGQND